MLKPFDAELYDADNSAVDTLIEWLNAQDWTAWVNPDKYGIDVLATSPTGRNWQIEVEVKHRWKGKDFPYPEVHFSGRKIKFANEESIFVMFNDDRSYALGVRGSVVKNCSTVEKDTVYTKDEAFISVPISFCRFWRFK